MNFPEILVLSLGVSMDATAVAAAQGLRGRALRPRDVVTISLLFGGFHFAMPLLGYAAGAQLGRRIAAWDHWLIAALLGGIGVKMLWEAATHKDIPGAPLPRLDPRVLLALAVATSLDVFAVGITLPLLRAPLWLTVSMLGGVTAAMSAVGVWLGRRFGARVGRRLDAFGGIVLVGLAVRVLVEHLTQGR